jgi:membrane protein insertase Oxa1/YidC/SpoIIIJ
MASKLIKVVLPDPLTPLIKYFFPFSITKDASFAIYWVTSNLFQIAQQFIFKKYLAPVTEEGEQK